MANHGTEGLTTAEVEARRAEAGWNEIPDPVLASPLTIVLRQFSSALILVLAVAAAIALALGAWIDALAIGLVVVLNAALGFVQEWRAETALAALRKLLSLKAVVLRDGVERQIPARELVPGDLVRLAAGDKVPADATCVTALELRLDESILTGESVPVEKEAGAPLLSGTALVAGRADARVTAIGAATEFGRIAEMTGSLDRRTTDLERKFGRLARQLGVAAVGIAAGIAALGIALGRDETEMLMTALSLSVAIVPEGLPAVVTITLALGAAAMVRHNALARRLQAVETLGAASVICTDKTGTLTENRMTATRIWTAARSYRVTGTGHDPAGHIEDPDGRRVRSDEDAGLAALLHAALHCNHARIERDGSTWRMTGAPTEGALVTLAYKGWHPLPEPDAIRAERPFSSDRKCMSVVVQNAGALLQLTKGAPEPVLAASSRIRRGVETGPLTGDDRRAIDAVAAGMAARGLRVLALAERPASPDRIDEDDLVFLGLVGLIDPPRPEVRAAVAEARAARIRVLMITGDSPITAQAIADEIGLSVAGTLTGDEISALDDSTLAARLTQDILIARARPEDKMRIISALQRDREIVAMTGDGVNDAPALKQADIGIAMGIRGTEVAREAADLVLLDDNFSTIVAAIAEGRRQFANIEKFVRYLLSSNAGEIVALVLNIALGGPLIFLATQILWMNLVTDGVTAVALGVEKAEPDLMEHPPRRSDAPILGLGGFAAICALGLYTGLASLWIFLHILPSGVDLARTTAFTAMVVFEKSAVFAFRSLRLPNWRIGWLSNPLLLTALCVTFAAQAAAVYWPPLQGLLHTAPIGLSEWQLIAAFVVPIVLLPETAKSLLWLRTRRRVARAPLTPA